MRINTLPGVGFTAGRRGWGVLVAALLLASVASATAGRAETGDPPGVTRLNSDEVRRLEQQRELVRKLARRYAGSTILGGSLKDLRPLQILVDRAGTRDRRLMDFAEPSFADRDRVYELQSIGVVIGDVIAKQHGLVWVAIDDEYGYGRALLHEATGHLVFPVTLVSKRYQSGIHADVESLYEQSADSIAAAIAAIPQKKRRTNPPRPVSGSGT